jgi:uncharacterized membrane protein YeaQ/YmgE (transglycosylase-associated protein family)
MNLVLWILFGGLVGWIASFVLNATSNREVMMTTLFGVLGGVIGGWIANIIGRQSLNDFNIYSIMASAIGAALVLYFGEHFTATDK